MSDRPDDPTPNGGAAWWADRSDDPPMPAWMPPPQSAQSPPSSGERASTPSAPAAPVVTARASAAPAATITPARPARPTSPGGPPVPPPRRRKRRFARFLAWTACVLSALILAVSIAGYYTIGHLVDSFDKKSGVIQPGGAIPKHGENYLLVGSDSREGLSRQEQSELSTGHADYGNHSDTMILAHISPRDGGHATLVSLPRDSLVEVPEFTDSKGKVHKAHRSKLNATYSLGGPKLTVATIQNATGLHIQHYVEINFTGFLKMVDAIGGVDVCITQAVARNLPDKDSGLDLPAGKSHIKGKQALAYVRARHIYPSQDLGRIQAQQKFIGAMIRQTLSAGTISNPLKVTRLLNALGGSVTTDAKFTKRNLVDLGTSLRNFSPSKVTFATVPVAKASYNVPGLGSTLLWDVDAAQAMFTLINQDKPVDDSRDDKTLRPSQVTVQVLNGSGTAGLGATTKRELEKSGFNSAGSAKTAEATTEQTTIRYSGEDGAAKALLRAVPGAQLSKVDGLGDTVELIIGKDFTGTTHLAPAPTPSGKPVTRSAADTSCS
jgi:LCP family protein required for cell wall assembly